MSFGLRQKRKYDFSKRAYERAIPVDIGHKVVMMERDYNAEINCANCGAVIKFGNSFTSMRWFDLSGVFALSVCRECHEKEIMERLTSRRIEE